MGHRAHGTLTSITAWRFWDWKPAERPRLHRPVDRRQQSQNPSQQDQYTQEFRFNHSGTTLDLVLGAFAFHQRIDTQGPEQQGADSRAAGTSTNASADQHQQSWTA